MSDSEAVGGVSAEAQRFLELFAMTGLAFAEPTFDLFRKNAGLFVADRTSGV